MKNKIRNKKIKLRIPISPRAPKIEKPKSSYSRKPKHAKNTLLGNILSEQL